MRGEIDVTLKRERSAAEYRETLALVLERLGEVAGLTDSLMLLVRAQEGGQAASLAEVPLVPLLRQSAARMSAAAGLRRIDIRLERFPDLVAYAEPRLLARVFDNLLLNATQFNRDAGSVVITGRVEEPHTPESWTAGQVVVRVRDTGFGIPAGEVERVFERFYRVDPSRSRLTGGTGLGLSICREVVRLFGGTIRIAATSDAGTEVEVSLPGRLASATVVDDVVVPAAAPVRR
jgi:signal transduction histidine kinase